MKRSVIVKTILRKIVKVFLNFIQWIFVIIDRGLGFIDFPVPPNSSMRKTSSRTVSNYYISGISTYLPIATCAIREGIKFEKNIRILDFGCGVGRQLLHFTRWYPKPNYYACDIDKNSIDFIVKNYPRVCAYANKFNPPLEYKDSFFHMIYSVSIFSHLNLEYQKKWLSELARITISGGLCFLTTEGLTSLKDLSKELNIGECSLKEKLNLFGFLYKEYDYLKEDKKMEFFLSRYGFFQGVTGSYGNAVLSSQYILKEWNTDYFEVLDIIEGIIDNRQDLVVLKRK